MYISNQTQEAGLPPAPMVEILDSAGTMPAGHYYFALMQDYREPRSGFGIMKSATIGQISGITALGPATHIRAETPWNTVRISDIPIDFERQYARIFMSVDSVHFYQIATAPAISMRQYYDMSDLTRVTGEQQVSGLYRVTVINPAQRFRENVGTMVTRDNVKNTYPFELDDMNFQQTFSAPNHTIYETANNIPPMPVFEISGREAIYQPIQPDRVPNTEQIPLPVRYPTPMTLNQERSACGAHLPKIFIGALIGLAIFMIYKCVKAK